MLIDRSLLLPGKSMYWKGTRQIGSTTLGFVSQVSNVREIAITTLTVERKKMAPLSISFSNSHSPAIHILISMLGNT